MPDNGLGAKDNSADFLLRVYKMEPISGTEIVMKLFGEIEKPWSSDNLRETPKLSTFSCVGVALGRS